MQRDEIMQRLTRIIADRLGSTGDRSGIVEESCLGRDHELNDAKRDEIRAELNKVFGASLSAEDLSPDAMADMGALADLIRARGAVPVQAGVESGVIRSARAEELGDVLELQRRAFAAVAERVGDMEIAPMVQTMPDIIREFESGIVLVYEQDGRKRSGRCCPRRRRSDLIPRSFLPARSALSCWAVGRSKELFRCRNRRRPSGCHRPASRRRPCRCPEENRVMALLRAVAAGLRPPAAP